MTKASTAAAAAAARPYSSKIRCRRCCFVRSGSFLFPFVVVCLLSWAHQNAVTITAFRPDGFRFLHSRSLHQQQQKQFPQWRHRIHHDTSSLIIVRRPFSTIPPPQSPPNNNNNNDDENENEDSFIDVNANDDNEDDLLPEGEIIFVSFGDDDTQGSPSAGTFLQEEDDAEEDDDEEENDVEDPYTQLAKSEFQDDESSNKENQDAGALTMLGRDQLDTTVVDWGGALSRLRERVQDVESGKSQDPSHVLYRMMSSQTPNQIIGKFVASANPQVVQAMSGAVGSLLGGLSNPNMGVETLVKASGEKIGSLCFQLQMTGT
jgi:hypothetical protein